MITASYHSIETMGLVDGPGIRTVFFLQGCSLRCNYCHNPDTQHFMGTKRLSIEEVVEKAKRYKSYYDASGGGVTFSGGEALVQGEFVALAFEALKAEGIHTCLDTSGYGASKYYSAVLKHTDHVLLDVKHVTDKAHEALTGKSLKGLRHFIESLKESDCKITVRHVMIPKETDAYDVMDRLLEIIEPVVSRVDKIEILPYHKSGVEKYEAMNLPYVFASVPEMDPERAQLFEAYVNQHLKRIQMASPSQKAV